MKSLINIICACILAFSTNITAANSRAFIIDTDMAVDDAIAILYLTQVAEVKAITVTGTGEAHCKPALKNLAGLLKLVNKKISYACGNKHPLRGNHHFINRVRSQADNLLNSADLLKSDAAIPLQSALNLLVETLQHAKQPIDILAIGPLTNIALLLQRHPDLKPTIHRIYIMGGAVHVPGNLPLADPDQKSLVAEWNIYIDPVAADIVFRSGIAITLVPLDVTNTLPITTAFYHKMERKHATPAADYIYQLFTRNQKNLLDNDWFFWDPLAAVIASDNQIAKTKIENLRVILAPEKISGATVVDNKNGIPVSVCLNVNKEQFENRLINLKL
jgi:pyrimidine-specific ribonucleoside hydrolase